MLTGDEEEDEDGEPPELVTGVMRVRVRVRVSVRVRVRVRVRVGVRAVARLDEDDVEHAERAPDGEVVDEADEAGDGIEREP